MTLRGYPRKYVSDKGSQLVAVSKELKAMKHAIGSQCLSYSEMQTVLFEIANLVNERPIGKHPNVSNDGH